ncbi:hypothetical protein HUN01_11375 [Nostoc edaphicum CCNP1411]|uniref:Uncharacterized protein n=1 Tax=Nostoc edaphicum CCNP1411 TaxID=1472755 RepID=A0A7D7QRY2_9NOSO|nr:hypothetical protein [Nostoc edaphicum]QMS88163.1 hypothetical protein HUN01_11375 [Nostoc edaphicum CCNP1411]
MRFRVKLTPVASCPSLVFQGETPTLQESHPLIQQRLIHIVLFERCDAWIRLQLNYDHDVQVRYIKYLCNNRDRLPKLQTQR